MAIKICPACQQTFECNEENIFECQCYQIQLNTQQKAMIANQYTDCLCSLCLNKLIIEKPLD